MKRFHIHTAVDNLESSIQFYSALFGQEPSKQREDYAKWMLEDPRLNFAISSRGLVSGINHLGIQVDSSDELTSLKLQAEKASAEGVLDQGETSCCYAKSEKHWILDPQGIAWENFVSVGESDEYGEDLQQSDGACCIPIYSNESSSEGEKADCCVPNADKSTKSGACC